MNVNNGAGPGPVRIKRRRCDFQRPILAVLADRVGVFRVSLVRVSLVLLGFVEVDLVLVFVFGGFLRRS